MPCHAVGSSPYFRTPGAAGKRAPDGASRGAAFYSVLLEFWVTDGDEPVPVAAPAGGGGGSAGMCLTPAAGAALW
jgi:hypothetical protein